MGGPISGGGGVGGPTLSDATPAALGVASAGVSTEASRADHVHALPTIPAVSSATPQPLGTATAGVSTEASRADHVHAGPIPLLAGVVTTAISADTVAGYGRVDPTGLASLTLAAVGQVVSGVTGTLDLYDLTAAAVVATLTWTETAPTRKTASVTVPGSARLYELRVRKSGGGASDYALFSAVSLIGG